MNKIEQKKEYIKPQLMVLEYECEGALLQGSPCCEDSVRFDLLDDDEVSNP